MATVALFLVFGARIFFINSGTAKSTSASPSNATAVKSNNTGGGGSGGSSRRAAEVSLAEAAHTDKLMRSSAAADRSAYRSTCQSPPGAPMGRYHIRDSFRKRLLLLPSLLLIRFGRPEPFPPRLFSTTQDDQLRSLGVCVTKWFNQRLLYKSKSSLFLCLSNN
ncbi:hypothetical protein ACTXT7_012008 [Hymenolepis weldensis]